MKEVENEVFSLSQTENTSTFYQDIVHTIYKFRVGSRIHLPFTWSEEYVYHQKVTEQDKKSFEKYYAVVIPLMFGGIFVLLKYAFVFQPSNKPFDVRLEPYITRENIIIIICALVFLFIPILKAARYKYLDSLTTQQLKKNLQAKYEVEKFDLLHDGFPEELIITIEDLDRLDAQTAKDVIKLCKFVYDFNHIKFVVQCNVSKVIKPDERSEYIDKYFDLRIEPPRADTKKLTELLFSRCYDPEVRGTVASVIFPQEMSEEFDKYLAECNLRTYINLANQTMEEITVTNGYFETSEVVARSLYKTIHDQEVPSTRGDKLYELACLLANSMNYTLASKSYYSGSYRHDDQKKRFSFYSEFQKTGRDAEQLFKNFVLKEKDPIIRDNNKKYYFEQISIWSKLILNSGTGDNPINIGTKEILQKYFLSSLLEFVETFAIVYDNSVLNADDRDKILLFFAVLFIPFGSGALGNVRDDDSSLVQQRFTPIINELKSVRDSKSIKFLEDLAKSDYVESQFFKEHLNF